MSYRLVYTKLIKLVSLFSSILFVSSVSFNTDSAAEPKRGGVVFFYELYTVREWTTMRAGACLCRPCASRRCVPAGLAHRRRHGLDQRTPPPPIYVLPSDGASQQLSKEFTDGCKFWLLRHNHCICLPLHYIIWNSVVWVLANHVFCGQILKCNGSKPPIKRPAVTSMQLWICFKQDKQETMKQSKIHMAATEVPAEQR